MLPTVSVTVPTKLTTLVLNEALAEIPRKVNLEVVGANFVRF